MTRSCKGPIHIMSLKPFQYFVELVVNALWSKVSLYYKIKLQAKSKSKTWFRSYISSNISYKFTYKYTLGIILRNQINCNKVDKNCLNVFNLLCLAVGKVKTETTSKIQSCVQNCILWELNLTALKEERLCFHADRYNGFCLKVVTHPITNPARPSLISELVGLPSLVLKSLGKKIPSPPSNFLLSVFSQRTLASRVTANFVFLVKNVYWCELYCNRWHVLWGWG